MNVNKGTCRTVPLILSFVTKCSCGVNCTPHRLNDERTPPPIPVSTEYPRTSRRFRSTEKSLAPARNRTLGGQVITDPYHFNGNFSVVFLCKLHLLGGRFPSGFPPISHLRAFLKQTGRADETSARMMWRSLGRKQACVCFHYTYRRSPQLILHCIQ
jgi:hypothetical protein